MKVWTMRSVEALEDVESFLSPTTSFISSGQTNGSEMERKGPKLEEGGRRLFREFMERSDALLFSSWKDDEGKEIFEGAEEDGEISQENLMMMKRLLGLNR